MYDNINVLHNIIENVGDGKISSDSHGEQLPVFFSTGLHLIGFGLGPRCPGNLDPAFEEEVYDVGTHKACGACDENVAGRGVIPSLGLDLLDLGGLILTEERTTLCYSSM
jgi:hypothetical protein